jgi:hypothetical protein
MGKWLLRVKEKGGIQEKKYQDSLTNNTDNTDKTPYIDPFDPELNKVVHLELLTSIERQAYDGWLWSVRQSKHGYTEEKARQIAWKLLIESLQSFSKRGAGRFKKTEYL